MTITAMRRQPTVAIVLSGSAAFLNLYATQPLLPLLQHTFNASRFAVGLTVTAPTIAVALSAPFVGRLADNLGLRRVIVGSAFLLALTTGLAALSTSLGQLIAWRFVQGITTPGIFAGTIAYIHEMWPASRAGRATAAYMTGTILGGFTGRVLAGLIAADARWQSAFAALAVVSLAIAITLFVSLPADAGSRHRARSRAGRGALLRHMRNGQLLTTYAIGFCVLFTNVAVFTYIPFYLAAPPFRLSTAALGWLFVVYLIGAVVTPFGGWWIDAYGHRAGLALAMAIGAAGALLTLATSLPAIIVGLSLVCTGVFVAQTTTSSYIGAVTTGERALAVGLYSTFYYTGGSVGAAAPAALWNLGGWAACVAVVVLLQIAAVVITFVFWRDARRIGPLLEAGV
jgi:MFS transporter, YNFM family, putative membrane transport protein